MKNILILIFCSLLLTATDTFAGFNRREQKKAAARTTLADPGEGDYDIKHLEFHLQVSDTSVHVAGNVTTTAQVTAALMNAYIFELDTVLTIDSALFNGITYPVVTTGGFTRKIVLSTPLPIGSMFNAQIFYHGYAPVGSGFFHGVTGAVTSGGTRVLYTVSDPWVAKDWWPCKQSVNDKIDSVDMFITTPNGVKDGSNGILVNVDSTSIPGYTTYHWQTRYPITYYLISMAVARYAEYRSYVHFSGSTDSMLVQNFLMDTTTFNPLYKANFDSVGYMIDYFSTLFGRYPFWREKYGMCYSTLGGGMENQTMTTIGVPDIVTIAHELTHQWFGDNVSYSNWGDVWLSEGFATFGEQLYLDHFWSPAAAKAHRKIYLGRIFGEPCGETFVTDTTTVNTLFDPRTVYAKGQGIATMLRYIAPVDSFFFQLLRTYQHNYAYGNASTADLKALAEFIYGINLDTFFNQWIYGHGYPMYKVSWNQAGGKVYVKLIQSPSCTSHPQHFNTPVQLEFRGPSADTIVKVYNTLDSQVFAIDWAPTMDTMFLNPDALIICQQIGRITHNRSLGIGSVLPRGINIHPNPAHDYWQIDELPGNTRLALLDMNGRTLWEGKSDPSGTRIPGSNLPAGAYVLRLSSSSDFEQVKLVHW